MKKMTWNILNLILSIVLAAICIGITGNIFDKYQQAYLNTWALMHGTIFVVFPAYVLLFLLALRPIARWLQVQDTLAGSKKQQSTSLLAILSVLLSGTGFLIPVVGSFLGIVSGHIARRRCKNRPEIYGSGIALAGLILGYLSLVYTAYVFGVVFWIASQSGS
jgi:uncharacterized membrane protein